MSVRLPGTLRLKETTREQWLQACEEALDAELYHWVLVLAEDASPLFFHNLSSNSPMNREIQTSCYSGNAVLRAQADRFELGTWKSSMTICDDGVLVQSALPSGCSLHLLAHQNVTPGKLWSQSSWLQSSLVETLG
jgi:hypothetical protein